MELMPKTDIKTLWVYLPSSPIKFPVGNRAEETGIKDPSKNNERENKVSANRNFLSFLFIKGLVGLDLGGLDLVSLDLGGLDLGETIRILLH